MTESQGSPVGLQEDELDAINKRIVVELQEQGTAVVSRTVLRGRYYLHLAITNHRSRREDFDLLVREVIRLSQEGAALERV